MKSRSHSSRGVASIIGGVFLVLIILSAYAFFMMSNQQTDDLQSTIRAMNAANDDKMQEKVVLNNVVRNGTNLRMNISNQGPKDIEIKYVGWMNEQKSNTTYTYTNTDLVISPGASTISILDVDNATGKYQIKVISESGNIYTATYPFVSQSSTSISLCKTNGQQGSNITLSGSGFTSNSPISIEFDQNPVTHSSPIVTDSSGAFSTTFIIPPSAIGAHNVKATDGDLFFASATFTVTP